MERLTSMITPLTDVELLDEEEITGNWTSARTRSASMNCLMRFLVASG